VVRCNAQTTALHVRLADNGRRQRVFAYIPQLSWKRRGPCFVPCVCVCVCVCVCLGVHVCMQVCMHTHVHQHTHTHTLIPTHYTC
jgi:hypothetical protein